MDLFHDLAPNTNETLVNGQAGAFIPLVSFARLRCRARNATISRDVYRHRTVHRRSLRGRPFKLDRRKQMALTYKLSLVALLSTLPLAAYAQDAQLTEPQIAAIVVTANQVDIDAGKLALGKTHTKQVRDFAKLMVTTTPA